MMNEQKMMELINDYGLIQTLQDVYGTNIQVEIGFSVAACETSIDDINFSVRSQNALKRAGIFTVRNIIEIIPDDGLLRIRNLGKKSINEIKTRILSFGYDQLSTAGKQEFIRDLMCKNTAIIGGK